VLACCSLCLWFALTARVCYLAQVREHLRAVAVLQGTAIVIWLLKRVSVGGRGVCYSKGLFTACARCFPVATQLLWLDMSPEEWLVWAATLTAGIGCFHYSMTKLKAACNPAAAPEAAAQAPGVAGTDSTAAKGRSGPAIGPNSGPGSDLAGAAPRARRRLGRGACGGEWDGGPCAAGGEATGGSSGAVDLGPYYLWHTAWHASLPLGAACWMAVRCARLDGEAAAIAMRGAA